MTHVTDRELELIENHNRACASEEWHRSECLSLVCSWACDSKRHIEVLLAEIRRFREERRRLHATCKPAISCRPTACITFHGILTPRRITYPIAAPLPGSREFVFGLHEFADIIIFRQTPPAVAGIVSADLREWLQCYKIPFDSIHASDNKPVASMYFDDRAVVCRPESDVGNVAVFDLALAQAKRICGIE